MCDGPLMPRIRVMECPQSTSKSVDFGTGPESPSEQETPGADAAQGTEIRRAPAEALCPPGAEGAVMADALGKGWNACDEAPKASVVSRTRAAGKVGKRRRNSPRFRRFAAEYARTGNAYQAALAAAQRGT